ncbi:MAG: hypothetical protein ACI8S6_002071 [Myxococcota bacterium]|jgi:hypothetical protein
MFRVPVLLSLLLWGCASHQPVSTIEGARDALADIQRASRAAELAQVTSTCASQQRVLLQTTAAAAERVAAEHIEHLARGQDAAADDDYARLTLAAQRVLSREQAMARCTP